MTDDAEKSRKIEIAELWSIMQTEGGRNFIARILKTAGVFSSTYVPGKPDETMRRSIKRDFGLWIEREVKEAAPEFYITLIREINKDAPGKRDTDDRTE